MQDSINRTGSNWGRTPRTVREAFPQYPGSDYVEPTVSDKILDVVVVVGVIAIIGLVARMMFIAFLGA
jgi:hypothetical protein